MTLALVSLNRTSTLRSPARWREVVGTERRDFYGVEEERSVDECPYDNGLCDEIEGYKGVVGDCPKWYARRYATEDGEKKGRALRHGLESGAIQVAARGHHASARQPSTLVSIW
jgi:hypothetical protein